MVLAFSAYIISFFVFYTFSDFYLSAAAMVLFGLGESFRSGTHKALILEYIRLNDMLDLKVAYYGRTRAASQLGSAFNSLIAAGLLFFTGDYRTMFLATTIPYVIDLINLATYPKELDGELVKFDRRALSSQAKGTLKDFAGIFRNRHAVRSILNSSGFSALFKTTKDYLQPILASLALAAPFLLTLDDVHRSGLVVGIVYFCIYLLTSYASRSSDRVPQGPTFRRATRQSIDATTRLGKYRNTSTHRSVRCTGPTPPKRRAPKGRHNAVGVLPLMGAFCLMEWEPPDDKSKAKTRTMAVNCILLMTARRMRQGDQRNPGVPGPCIRAVPSLSAPQAIFL